MRTIFCDVGGVILDETFYGPLLSAAMSEALSAHGVEITREQLSAGMEACVRSFVPGLRTALAWYFTKPDTEKCDRVAAQVRASLVQWSKEHPRCLTPGIRDALEALSASFTLVLAGNAPSHTKSILAELEVLHFFAKPEVSEDIGLSKPDARFFEYLLRKHDLKPEEVAMVGDRLDNDIIPAKLLGMPTVLVKTGLYAILEPRTPREIPDATVTAVRELPDAIARLSRPQAG